MKKIYIIIMITTSMLVFAGCGNSGIINKAKEQAELALANMDYDKALASYKLAIEKGAKDDEIKILSTILEEFIKANELYEENKLEEAQGIIDKIDKSYANYSIKKDIDELKNNIDQQLIKNKESEDKILNIKKLIKENKINSANEELNKIDKSAFKEEQIAKIEKLKIEVNEKLQQIEIEEKKKNEFDWSILKDSYEIIEYNQYGVQTSSTTVNLIKNDEKTIHVSGGSYHLQRIYIDYIVETLNAEAADITQDMVEDYKEIYKNNSSNVSSLGRGSSLSGEVKYVGNNKFEGLVYNDGTSKEEKCSIVVEGKSIKFSLGNEVKILK